MRLDLTMTPAAEAAAIDRLIQDLAAGTRAIAAIADVVALAAAIPKEKERCGVGTIPPASSRATAS